MRNFADRVADAVREKGTALCVGLDPRYGLLPREITGVAESAPAALWVFNKEVIEIAAGEVGAVKVQVAFYERYGWEGMEVFGETLRYARERGLLTIADVKRGDIGSTAEAYAAAHLAGPDAPDAVTVNGYFGFDGLAPFVDAARAAGRGLFVLVRTSNPSAAGVQDFADADGKKLYEHLAAQVAMAEGATVHVMTRSPAARRLALELGAASAGDTFQPPPEPLDSAVIFAPAGEVVPTALEALDRVGRWRSPVST